MNAGRWQLIDFIGRASISSKALYGQFGCYAFSEKAHGHNMKASYKCFAFILIICSQKKNKP